MEFIPEKKLGFGLMRLPHTDPNDAGTIDIEEAKKMVDIFMAKGFTYFDTAWMYCNFQSENAVKEILTSRYPRESFTLTTKLHSGFFNSLEDRDKVFNAQKEKTGVDYFDYYLLHGIEDGSYEKYEKFDCFNWLLGKKKSGEVRHAGFSYHGSPELLDEILTKHSEMEMVQLQINYLDWDSPFIRAKECYEVCVKHGKKVIVMEPIKGGTLAEASEEEKEVFDSMDSSCSIASWAVRFVASLENVMVVLSGMSNVAQMEDNTSYMENFKPLKEEEKNNLFKVADMKRANTAIPCTGCSYCTDGCPKHIAIPKYFALYNGDMREAATKGWTINGTYYNQIAEKAGKASECIKCGKCEHICPQHLSIRKYLEDVAAHFEQH